jgi:ankyrin repeat protein
MFLMTRLPMIFGLLILLVGFNLAVGARQSVGPDPNAPDVDGFRPMANAARLGDLDRLAALFDAGGNPNLRDAGGNGWVPLMHAAHKHQTAAVRLLLDRGALADGPAGLSLTPLMMAVASGQTDVARLLLDHGADPRRRTADGASLLTLAVSGGALTDIDEPLLGGCHPDPVRLLKTRAPDLAVDRSLRGRVARFFAWLNGCSAVLTTAGNAKI